jgi:transcriptional adapter 2-alpha
MQGYNHCNFQVQANERKRTKEERDWVQQTRVFARLMTLRDYQSFADCLLAEQNLRARIAQLQEYRRHGITNFQQAEVYEQDKKHRLQNTLAKSPFVGTSDRIRQNKLIGLNGTGVTPSSSMNSGPSDTKSSAIYATAAPLDLMGCDGVDLLTASEQALCSNLRILPRAYLVIKQAIMREYAKSGELKRRDVRKLVRIDVNKLGKVYDFFVSKGWIRSSLSHSPGIAGSSME